MVIRDDPNDDGITPRKSREKRFQQKLEHLICRDADLIWWFTDGALQYAQLRNPELGNKGFVVFPGAEPPGCHFPLPDSHTYTQELILGHFGSIANDRSLAPVMWAMKQFFLENPQAEHIIKIHVYGSALDDNSKEAMTKLELEKNIISKGRLENDALTGKSGRERIMEVMRQVDVLLLLHGDYEWCAEYIPSKTYDYFWSSRPIWGVTNRNLQFDQILLSRNSYISHTLEQESILVTLRKIWQDWQQQKLPYQLVNPVSPKDAVDAIIQRL
jgi:glycosyltransferase involved in cell wall biosynthesis